MQGIKLKPPVWAVGLPEEVWMERILARAGYRPTNTNGTMTEATSAAAAAAATAAADKAKKKKKKAKAKKAKAAKEAAEQQSAAPAAEDFETEFPPVAPAQASVVAAQ